MQICSVSRLKKIKFCSYNDSGVVEYRSALQRFEHECALLAILSHPNIVQYVEVQYEYCMLLPACLATITTASTCTTPAGYDCN